MQSSSSGARSPNFSHFLLPPGASTWRTHLRYIILRSGRQARGLGRGRSRRCLDSLMGTEAASEAHCAQAPCRCAQPPKLSTIDPETFQIRFDTPKHSTSYPVAIDIKPSTQNVEHLTSRPKDLLPNQTPNFRSSQALNLKSKTPHQGDELLPRQLAGEGA